MALYAFDGTWNRERNAGEYDKNTNVVRFRDAYSDSYEFYKGVGTKLGLIGKIFGGAFGAGGKDRIHNASKDLFERYAHGDTMIDIIGFSRGAALALHFANTINRNGIRDPASGNKLVDHPKIRFLGLWDVVASFGIPINIGIPFNRINLGYTLTLPKNVEYCFHAIALDELRQTFRVTRIKDGYEVWFRGVHSDIGGGNENMALNNISLRWMMKKAIAVGLSIKREVLLALDAEIDTSAEISRNLDPIKNKPRGVGSGDRIHYTVSYRPGNEHVNPPRDALIETKEDEANIIDLKHEKMKSGVRPLNS